MGLFFGFNEVKIDMGYTLAYGAKNLTAKDIKVGIAYVRDNANLDLFKIDYLGEDGIVLNMAEEPLSGEAGVERFTFPPHPYGSLPYNLIKTNEVQPHDGHVKQLLSGLEKLLQGKFAATDHHNWSVGSYSVRKEIGLDH